MDRLSKKQLIFLQAFRSYMGGVPTICISNMPEEVWFTFRSEFQAYEWVRNLAARGFCTIEQDCFARLTEKGLEAIK